jgi:Flp pilus assembly protein TadG
MSPPTRASRFDGDQGSVVAEFALVLPLLAGLLLGIFEFGMLFRQQIDLADAVQAAARVGSHAGKSRSADQLALSSLALSLPNLRNSAVTRVLIFKSTSTDGTISSTCKSTATSGGGAGVSSVTLGYCNVYSWAQVQGAPAGTGFTSTAGTCSATALDRFWCPTTRADSIIAPGGPDQLGIQVELTYTYITKVLGGGTTRSLTERATFRIEALDR